MFLLSLLAVNNILVQQRREEAREDAPAPTYAQFLMLMQMGAFTF
jgi:hypothetical protein